MEVTVSSTGISIALLLVFVLVAMIVAFATVVSLSLYENFGIIRADAVSVRQVSVD
jgi:hypothetical protein